MKTCPICKEDYYSIFDKKYIEIKGACYNCITDDELTEEIFENMK